MLDKSKQHHNNLHPQSESNHRINNINLPKPLPNLNEWEYKPPPIFCPPTVNIKTAETLQQLLELEYGITFQTPKPGRPYPFLTPSKEY